MSQKVKRHSGVHQIRLKSNYEYPTCHFHITGLGGQADNAHTQHVKSVNKYATVFASSGQTENTHI